MDREIKLAEVFAIFIIVLAFCGLGLVFLSGFAKGAHETVKENVVTRQLMAEVKGSIYGSNEMMSVFGICVDSYDIPAINSTASFSAWYPNGTQFIFSDNMTWLAEGYFLWDGYMPVVGGTFLTEFTCEAFGQVAKAWGEWQNPVWVQRVSDVLELANLTYLLMEDVNGNIIAINATLEEIEAAIAAINLTINWTTWELMIGNLSVQINTGITAIVQNITYLRGNMSSNFDQTNQLILQTQIIANSSVDRNNSLLAYLLYLLINGTGSPVTHNLTWTEDYGEVIFWKDWTIDVVVYDEYGGRISYPDVDCTIETSLHPLQYMDPQGSFFRESLFIDNVGEFSWIVQCFYV